MILLIKLSFKNKNIQQSYKAFLLYVTGYDITLQKNSIIFVENMVNEEPFLNFNENMALSMAIKCFGQRATFVDQAYPFDESSLLEWSERKYYYHNLDLHDKKELIKIIKKYSISHFLIDVNKSFELPRAKSVWESENFTLVEVNI